METVSQGKDVAEVVIGKFTDKGDVEVERGGPG